MTHEAMKVRPKKNLRLFCALGKECGSGKFFTFFSFFQAPDGESQPSTEVDLFISTEKIMVLNTDLKVILQLEMIF